jgi:hypothetical protein
VRLLDLSQVHVMCDLSLGGDPKTTEWALVDLKIMAFV